MIRTLRNFAKRAFIRLARTPRGVRIGIGSTFRRPWRISNPSFIHVGARTRIGPDIVLNAMRDYEGIPCDGRITIGDDVYIGGYSQIHAMRHIQLGDGVVLSEFVYISDTSHGLDPKAGLIMKQPLEHKGPVKIGKHCFLGYGSAVLPGCELGEHCIVGARSMVTCSFPAYSMVTGAPAKLIKTYNHETGEWVRVQEGVN